MAIVAGRSGEDAHPTRTDEQAHDDQDDAPQHLAAEDREDARDHEDHGQDPQQCDQDATPTCAGARSAPCTWLMITGTASETAFVTSDGRTPRSGPPDRNMAGGRAGTAQFLYRRAPMSGRQRGIAVPQQLGAAFLLVDLPD